MSPQPRSLPDNCSSRQPGGVAQPRGAHRRVRHLQEVANGAGPPRRDASDGHAGPRVGEGGGRSLLHDAGAVRHVRWRARQTRTLGSSNLPLESRAAAPSLTSHQFECTPYSNGPIGISEWAIGGGRCSTCYILTRGAHGPRTPAPRLNAHPPPAACRPAALARWVDLTPAVWVPQVQCANMSSGSARRCLSSQHV